MEAGPLARELPGLGLRTAGVALPGPVVGRAPRDLRDRLAALSDRMRGARAVALRTEPVTSAHRAFFRQVGLDPDVERVPLEAAVVERLLTGAFASGSLLDAALLIALLDTGVAVWAVDAATVAGPLKLDVDGSDRRLVVADGDGPIAPLFAAPPAGRTASGDTRSLLLYAVQVPGVPDAVVDEALWTAREALGAEP